MSDPLLWGLHGILSGSTPFKSDSVPNLFSWAKADDISSLFQVDGGDAVGSDGDVVGSWVNQILGKHTQSTTVDKPIYRSNTPALGGMPALEFNGTSSNLINSVPFINNAMTIFIVVASAAVGGTKHILSETAGSTDRFHIAAVGNSFESRRYTGSYVSGDQTIAEDISGNIIVARLGATCDLWKNGVIGAGLGTGISSSTPHSQIGGNATSNFFGGRIAEILVYHAALMAYSMNIVQSYLSGKYSVNVARFS